jgi:DNA anti-recombination protein RmuC
MTLAAFQWPAWLTFISITFGVLLLLGGGWVVLQSGIQTKTAELWKERSEAVDARLQESKDENKECQAALAEMRAQIAGQNHEIETLRNIATAGPAIDAMAKEMRTIATEAQRTVAAQHSEVLGYLGQISGALTGDPDRRGGGGRTS